MLAVGWVVRNVKNSFVRKVLQCSRTVKFMTLCVPLLVLKDSQVPSTLSLPDICKICQEMGMPV